MDDICANKITENVQENKILIIAIQFFPHSLIWSKWGKMAQPTIRRWRRIIHSKMIFKIILGILILVFLLTMFISIKFCVHSLPSNSDESFYIIRHSLSENRWLVIGDQTGLFSKNTIPELVIRPKNIFFGFEKIVSVDLLYILDSSTTFIVRGKTTADEFLD
jgi:hypothetical protein